MLTPCLTNRSIAEYGAGLRAGGFLAAASDNKAGGMLPFSGAYRLLCVFGAAERGFLPEHDLAKRRSICIRSAGAAANVPRLRKGHGGEAAEKQASCARQRHKLGNGSIRRRACKAPFLFSRPIGGRRPMLSHTPCCRKPLILLDFRAFALRGRAYPVACAPVWAAPRMRESAFA